MDENAKKRLILFCLMAKRFPIVMVRTIVKNNILYQTFCTF